ncbi:uncharacterized protein LOC142550117 [Primulina tabacum]|uniref:uncharacterized protein LOC142550117 n=1 Tax=Primulina tabacum TaxID=48773 RepID=UPI003F5A0952
MWLIKMISGDSTGGDSNRARKSRSRRDCMDVEGARKNEAVISFGPEDLKGVNLPQNDALVIQAWVANYDILRVFVDSGSSVNVIFKDAFMQMDSQGYHLEAIETALFGFANHVVYPEGEIVLPLTLGSPDLKKTVMTSFNVVDSPSSYNIILGRPAMNELKAVASTYNQKIKFLVGARIRADPSKTRREGKNVRVDEVGGRVLVKGEQELIGISPLISEHQLNILPGSHPVKQKKRHFGPEKDKVIDEQSTGKWRMCVDFRDLNKACPKDHYPLPRIDQLVDSTSGFELLSFMDAYQGYHQIPLAKSDQDKTSFITSGGTFCYVVMLFGLKNAGDTYQRLMNRVFEKATGLECGVLREAQQFGWDEKCEHAFQDLKIHLAELPVLVKPEPGEKLFVYLSTTEYAVSSVMIKEEGSDQKPVYYVSHALRVPELQVQ